MHSFLAMQSLCVSLIFFSNNHLTTYYDQKNFLPPNELQVRKTPCQFLTEDMYSLKTCRYSSLNTRQVCRSVLRLPHFQQGFFALSINVLQIFTCISIHMYVYTRQLIFLRESDCLGCSVLLCLVVCLTLLDSFFLPSHLSLTT